MEIRIALPQLDAKDQVKLLFLIGLALCVFGFSFGQTASYDAAQREMVAKARAAQAAAGTAATTDAPVPNPVDAVPSEPPSVPGTPGA